MGQTQGKYTGEQKLNALLNTFWKGNPPIFGDKPYAELSAADQLAIDESFANLELAVKEDPKKFFKLAEGSQAEASSEPIPQDEPPREETAKERKARLKREAAEQQGSSDDIGSVESQT